MSAEPRIRRFSIVRGESGWWTELENEPSEAARAAAARAPRGSIAAFPARGSIARFGPRPLDDAYRVLGFHVAHELSWEPDDHVA